MHDPESVRGVERFRDLDREGERLTVGQRPFLQPVREVFPRDVLHDEVVDPVLVSHVVERADVRVVELRERFRLSLEALPPLGARGEVLDQDLDGDRAIETGVAGLVDFPHPARSDGSDDLVGTELLTGAEGHLHLAERSIYRLARGGSSATSIIRARVRRSAWQFFPNATGSHRSAREASSLGGGATYGGLSPKNYWPQKG